MTPSAQPTDRLTVVAWLALAVALVSAGYLAHDIRGRGYRQPMRVMEAVWPVTALYFGPLAIWGYHRVGRPESHEWLRRHGRQEPPSKATWVTTAIGVSHCGAGTLGDIAAEFAVFGPGLMIAGQTLYPEYLGDYVLAVSLGLAFQ